MYKKFTFIISVLAKGSSHGWHIKLSTLAPISIKIDVLTAKKVIQIIEHTIPLNNLFIKH